MRDSIYHQDLNVTSCHRPSLLQSSSSRLSTVSTLSLESHTSREWTPTEVVPSYPLPFLSFCFLTHVHRVRNLPTGDPPLPLVRSSLLTDMSPSPNHLLHTFVLSKPKICPFRHSLGRRRTEITCPLPPVLPIPQRTLTWLDIGCLDTVSVPILPPTRIQETK